jgi:hypothetical protein
VHIKWPSVQSVQRPKQTGERNQWKPGVGEAGAEQPRTEQRHLHPATTPLSSFPPTFHIAPCTNPFDKFSLHLIVRYTNPFEKCLLQLIVCCIDPFEKRSLQLIVRCIDPFENIPYSSSSAVSIPSRSIPYSSCSVRTSVCYHMTGLSIMSYGTVILSRALRHVRHLSPGGLHTLFFAVTRGVGTLFPDHYPGARTLFSDRHICGPGHVYGAFPSDIE